MEYLVDGHKFSLSYQELREKYHEFCIMSDEDFMKSLPAAAHFACIVSWLKELPNDCTIGDKGIVHELIHLMHIPEGNTVTLQQIRELFKKNLELC